MTDKTTKTVKFTKEQIVNSKRYIDDRDLLNAILDESKNYSHEEIQKEKDKYYKKKVI